MEINKKSSLPLYVQVAQKIRELLEQKPFNSGSFLPNEFELAQRYGVSRHTLRSAMQYLEDRNLIIREQGKGTRKNDSSHTKVITNLSAWHSLGSEIRQKTLPLKLHKIDISEEPSPANVSSIFSIPDGEKIVTLKRIYGDEKPSVYFHSYFNPSSGISQDILQHNKEQLHLYEVIEHFLGDKVTESDEILEAMLTPHWLQQELNLNEPDVVIVRQRIVKLSDKSPLEYNVGYYIASAFQFELNICSK